MFTSWDGCTYFTLIETHLDYYGHCYRSILIERFLQHATSLGFEMALAMTVPPEVKPAYWATIAFYQKHGFTERRRYQELSENGAVELVKDLRL